MWLSDSDTEEAGGTRAEERQNEVRASVEALLELIERERTGLELFGQSVELLNARNGEFTPANRNA